MPGSCEADNNSSSSLVSSLRKYRLKERPKYQPIPPKVSPQSNTNNSQASDSDRSSNSTSLNQNTPQRSHSKDLSSAASTSSASQSYSPLSYRKYEISHTSSFILPHVLTKIQQTLKRSKPGLVDLTLELTEEEYTKFKEIVLKEPKLGENWNTSVIETSSYITCGIRELKINRLYLIELRNNLKSCLENPTKNTDSSLQPEATPNNFKPVRTYSRTPKTPIKPKTVQIVQPIIPQEATNNITLKPEIPTKGIMDEYEVFCEKEQSLRKLLDAFPGADIMEGQDILVRCNWDISEAIKIAHSMPLRCSKKKALQYAATHGNQSPEPENNQSSSSSTNHKMAEEILLDSSDEDIDNSNQQLNSKRTIELEQNYVPSSKRKRVLSSSDSENESTDVIKSKTLTTSAVSLTNTTTPASSSTSSETTFTMSKSITIKPVSSVSEPPKEKSEPPKEKSSNSGDMPNFPKGLSITQLGSLNITKLVSKNETPEENGNKTVNMVNQKAEVITIPVSSQSNSNKALLVRIKKSNKNPSNGIDSDGSIGYTIQNTRSVVSPSELDTSSVSSKPDTSPISSKPASDEDIMIYPTEEPRKKKSKKREKGKRKKYALSDDDDEDYGNVDIYNSDDSDIEENLTPAHSAVLKFFQEASVEELSSIPSCSKKKVEVLLNIRPLANWADLVLKLNSDKLLSTDLLNGAKKVLDMRNAINKLMAKCQQISLDMEDLVESLKEKRENSTNYVAKQPELLNENMHLAPYQMLGLNWLLLLHNQEVNGILADEMGLGKTVQALSFLAYLKQIGEIGPHLIVVPSSTLDNWRLEALRWWPSVSILLYHGSQEARRELRFKVLNDEVDEFDVMITTYNMITSSSEDRGFFKRLEFLYVIFDEAHMLKNMASQRYQHLMKIRAPRRLLLTGTPLQNNLVELMSLLIFAMPDMFSGKTEQVKQMFTAVSKSDGNKNSYEKERIEHAKRIMKPFVLRRLKREVLKDLPEKHEEIKRCPMVEDQEIKYQRLVEKFSAEVENNQGGSEKMSSSGAGMMMQLRRGANHPLLLKEFYDDDKLMEMSKEIIKEPTHVNSDPNLVFEDMSIMSDFELHKLCQQFQSLNSFALSDEQILNSGKFKILDELLPDLIDGDHRILLFSQFTMVLDIIEEYMHIRQYMYFRLDGQTPVSERQEMIDQFNNDPSISLFLLSTRAGGLGINLTAADTVIIHDIDFNPYNDKQAEDRCHRVGQTKDVTVIRFISANTIEENILQCAKEKLKLEKDIHEESDTDENDSANVAKLLRDALGLKNTKS